MNVHFCIGLTRLRLLIRVGSLGAQSLASQIHLPRANLHSTFLPEAKLRSINEELSHKLRNVLNQFNINS